MDLQISCTATKKLARLVLQAISQVYLWFGIVSSICTGISSEIRTKLLDWAVWQARAGCYFQAALSSNDSEMLYNNLEKRKSKFEYLGLWRVLEVEVFFKMWIPEE